MRLNRLEFHSPVFSPTHVSSVVIGWLDPARITHYVSASPGMHSQKKVVAKPAKQAPASASRSVSASSAVATPATKRHKKNEPDPVGEDTLNYQVGFRVQCVESFILR